MRVVISSDYAPIGVADADDHVSMGFLFLCCLGRFDLSRVIVGALPTKPSRNPLADFQANVLAPFEEEKQYLGIDYSPAVALADSNESKLSDYEVIDIESMPNIQALVAEVEQGAYLLNWGILTEYAILCKYLEANRPELLASVKIISHATAPANINNCRKDSGACAYLHALATENKIKFYELGLSGARGIDDRSGFTGKLSSAVLDSKIGALFGEKWIDAKPDFSDAMTVVVLAFPEIFGDGYLGTLLDDGTDNFKGVLAAFKEADGKQKLYDIIEEKAALIVGGVITEPDPEPEPEPTPDPEPNANLEARILAIEQKIGLAANALS